MITQDFTVFAYVSLILRRDNTILLIRRFKTGSSDGLYACAGGRLDGDEPLTHAMAREACEEIGIQLKRESLKMVHVLHTKQNKGYRETVGFFMEATVWEGDPKNMEPHKHDDIGWFPISSLPQNTMPTLLHVLRMREQGLLFSEYGWD